jgi:ATP-dependent Lon protease
MPIALGRESSIAAAQEAVRNGHKIALLAQRDPSVEHPRAGDLYDVGVIATVIRYVTTPDGAHQLICQGEERFRLLELIRELRFWPRVSNLFHSRRHSAPRSKAGSRT